MNPYLVDWKLPDAVLVFKLKNCKLIPLLCCFIMCSINSITVREPSFPSPASWSNARAPDLFDTVPSSLSKFFAAPFKPPFSWHVWEYDSKHLFNQAKWSTFRDPPKLSGIEDSGSLCGNTSLGTTSILSFSLSWRKFMKKDSTALNQSGGEIMKTFLSLAG